MGFLTNEDYKVVCGEDALIVISQVDAANLLRAEKHAIGEISSYLFNRYDMTAAYQKQGEERSEYLVSMTCDVVLYHLIAAMPRKMGFDIRKERYEHIIDWLTLAQAGKVGLDVDFKTDENGNVTGLPSRFNPGEKNNYLPW